MRIRFEALETRFAKHEAVFDVRYQMIEKELHKTHQILTRMMWLIVTAAGAVLWEVFKKNL